MARARATCLEKAVELLSRRAHLERELSAKLASRGYADDEVDAAFARLRELGYLDDEAAARQWAEARLRRGPRGRIRLKADLMKRGADADLAAAVAAELTDDDDLESAREAARRTRSRGDSLARRLQRQGFSARAARRVVRELGDDATG